MKNFFLVVGLMCFVVGCGSSGATVTGKVTMDDGSAAPRGTVSLVGEAGTFLGPIESGGTYTIVNVADGSYDVAVTGVSNEVPDDSDAGMEFDDETGEYVGEELEAPPSLIKDIYSNPTTSGLSITVPGGSYDLQLERAEGSEPPAEEDSP